MLKKLLFAVILLTSIAACKSRAAFDYSEGLANKEQALVPEIQKTEAGVKTFFADRKFDSIGATGARMEKMVEAKLNEIQEQAAPDAKGADDFKRANIKYFQFIKSVYTEYRIFGNAASEDERQKILTELQDIVSRREEAVADIKRAQQKFADANGFKIQK